MFNLQGLIGKSLGGRYRIDELVGHGGMSAVYKGFDPNLKRIVAIKIIHAHLASDSKFITRFEEEAASVARLRHPNIVQVYDFNQDGGMYYMVLEFVPGETLQERLRRLNRTGRRMSITEAVRYTIQLCQATDYAHKHGLIHRDIKPANVILDVNNQAILMDFGIVKIVGGEKHTATGAVVGTALYMPPEMIRGETPDPRSDMYALGVTLYEMVSGRTPFESDSAMTLMMMHINDPVPDLRHLRPEVSDELIAVIEKSLAKDREQRFRSMGEMGSALEGFLKSAGLDAVATSTVPGQTDRQSLRETLPEITEMATLADALSPALTPAGLQAIPIEPAPYSSQLEESTEKTDIDQMATGDSTQPADLASAQTVVDLDTPPPGSKAAAVTAEAFPAQGEQADAGDATRIDQSEVISRETPAHGPMESPVGERVEPAGSELEIPLSAEVENRAVPLPVPDIPTVVDQPIPADQSRSMEMPNAPAASAIETSHPAEAQIPAPPRKTRINPLVWAGAGAVILLVVLGIFFVLGNNTDRVEATATNESIAIVVEPQISPTATEISAATSTLAIVVSTTVSPVPTDIPLPTHSPIPTIPVGVPYAVINDIQVDDQGRYVVKYETFEFTEQMTGLHLVFLFDSYSLDQGYMYGGPRPFTKFEQDIRPENSSQICVLVSNPDHSVQPDSGNCFNLPDVVLATLDLDAACTVSPPDGSPDDIQLKAGESVLVRGISADEGWWNVLNPQNDESSCWLPTSSVSITGDISTLPLIEQPLQPSNDLAGLFVEITRITSNNQGQFVVEYSTRGFTEQLPGTHIHFYFDNVTADQVGMSGGGRRLMYGGPSPFTGFLVSDKPEDAERICALVATPAHEVIANSGNCLAISSHGLPAGGPAATATRSSASGSDDDY